MSNLYYVNKSLLLISVALLALFTSGCDNNPAAPEPAKQVITLNQDNIDKYAMKVADDYIKHHDQLLNAFYQAKESNDSDAFNHFRNKQWTPDYSAKKQIHSDVYNHNQDFLKNHAAAKLFVLYDHLIYISLDLKHGLQQNNQEKLDAATKQAKLERQQILDLVIQIASSS